MKKKKPPQNHFTLASCQFYISNQQQSEKTPSVSIHQQDINKSPPLRHGCKRSHEGKNNMHESVRGDKRGEVLHAPG